MDLIVSESEHLCQGSSNPPKQNDILRLYSMRLCPYAERARIILLAKNLHHDIVNINLQKKPDWFLKLNPQGKVPALDIGSKILVESLDICDYLDETYPEPKLYLSDAEEKARDKEFIQKFNYVIERYHELLKNPDNKPIPEIVKPLVALLEEFENELSSKGDYFGGSQPGMVDYMIWPWAERAGVAKAQLGEKLQIPEDKITRIRAWCNNMKKLDAIKNTIISTDRHIKYWRQYTDVIQYDNI